jgi:hypothetical protein
MCEASAAVAVGPNHFLVADDEDSIGLYERNTPKPVWIEKLKTVFGVKVSDLEGAAAIGNRVYWVTSHSLNKDGEDKDQRRLLLAAEIVGEGGKATIKAVGNPYGSLREDMLGDKALEAFGLKEASKLPAEDKGSFNIEGLAATTDGKLLIGFRSPIPVGRALIIPLENPDEVVMQGVKAKFGQPKRPDLDGFGIRSLERVGDSYLIVAGPFGEGSDFSLRRWSGAEGEKPQIISLPALAGLAPEALFAVRGTNTVQILSDDGKFRKELHGKKCDKAGFPKKERKFRSIVVTP